MPDDVDASHLTNIVRPGESVFYDIHHGIVTWDVAGERTGHAPAEGFSVPASAVAVSLEGLSLGSIEPNDNPNTLYFTGDGGSTPASLSGRNVVNDGSAASVVLKDGYDFFTPKALTATTISYERKFTQGHATADAGWGTIVLPFAATSVTSGGQDIDWHHSSTDSGSISLSLYGLVSIWSSSHCFLEKKPLSMSMGLMSLIESVIFWYLFSR